MQNKLIKTVKLQNYFNKEKKAKSVQLVLILYESINVIINLRVLIGKYKCENN